MVKDMGASNTACPQVAPERSEATCILWDRGVGRCPVSRHLLPTPRMSHCARGRGTPRPNTSRCGDDLLVGKRGAHITEQGPRARHAYPVSWRGRHHQPGVAHRPRTSGNWLDAMRDRGDRNPGLQTDLGSERFNWSLRIGQGARCCSPRIWPPGGRCFRDYRSTLQPDAQVLHAAVVLDAVAGAARQLQVADRTLPGPERPAPCCPGHGRAP